MHGHSTVTIAPARSTHPEVEVDIAVSLDGCYCLQHRALLRVLETASTVSPERHWQKRLLGILL